MEKMATAIMDAQVKEDLSSSKEANHQSIYTDESPNKGLSPDNCSYDKMNSKCK